MHSEIACANGFVLSHTDFRERDLILRIAVEGHGLCAFIAKGARGSRKRFGGALDVLVPSNLTFRKKDSGLGQLREAYRISGPEPSASDIAAYGVRCYTAEYLLATVEENHPTGYPFKLMSWVYDALSDLSFSDKPKERALWVLNRVRVIGLNREGRCPDLFRCSDCQVDFTKGSRVGFTRDRGIFCESCMHMSGDGFPMSFGHLLEFRELYQGGAFSGEWCSRELTDWLESQIVEVLGRELSSNRILKSLVPDRAV